MANRAFRRMVEQRRAYLNYPVELPGQYIQEEPVEEITETVQVKNSPEKEILDSLHLIWNAFKKAETERERNEFLKVIDNILSK